MPPGETSLGGSHTDRRQQLVHVPDRPLAEREPATFVLGCAMPLVSRLPRRVGRLGRVGRQDVHDSLESERPLELCQGPGCGQDPAKRARSPAAFAQFRHCGKELAEDPLASRQRGRLLLQRSEKLLGAAAIERGQTTDLQGLERPVSALDLCDGGTGDPKGRGDLRLRHAPREAQLPQGFVNLPGFFEQRGLHTVISRMTVLLTSLDRFVNSVRKTNT